MNYEKKKIFTKTELKELINIAINQGIQQGENGVYKSEPRYKQIYVCYDKFIELIPTILKLFLEDDW